MQQQNLNYGMSETEHLVPVKSSFQPRWYAAYVCSRHEKRVAQELERRAIQSYLPLYQKTSRWKDRRVNLELPLFPGYVFVRLPLHDRLRLVTTPGLVRLVEFQGRPAPLPEDEIERLREGLSSFCAEPYPFLTTGRRVRILQGALAGQEGVLVRRKGRCRFVLSLDLIQRSISVDIEAASLEVIPPLKWSGRAQASGAGKICEPGQLTR
jgi:transcription antitermination factor NusG